MLFWAGAFLAGNALCSCCQWLLSRLCRPPCLLPSPWPAACCLFGVCRCSGWLRLPPLFYRPSLQCKIQQWARDSHVAVNERMQRAMMPPRQPTPAALKQQLQRTLSCSLTSARLDGLLRAGCMPPAGLPSAAAADAAAAACLCSALGSRSRLPPGGGLSPVCAAAGCGASLAAACPLARGPCGAWAMHLFQSAAWWEACDVIFPRKPTSNRPEARLIGSQAAGCVCSALTWPLRSLWPRLLAAALPGSGLPLRALWPCLLAAALPCSGVLLPAA